MQNNKNIHVVGIQMDLGASKRGMNMGPLAIRYFGLIDKISSLGFNVLDKGDIVPIKAQSICEKMKNFESIHEANSRLYHSVKEILNNNAFPIILGGDHSVAAGSIPAVKSRYGKIGIIWIDAHGDFNNDETTSSGNMHGMPLSAVCGFGPDSMVNFGEGLDFVDTKNVVLIAGRDYDQPERERLKKSGVNVYSISDIDRLGMNEVMKRALAAATNGTAGFHLSFDIDAVSPEGAPGVGTPVHSGLTIREAFLAAEMIAESDKLLSLDMVEVNMVLDSNNKTGILAGELILSCLGKTVY